MNNPIPLFKDRQDPRVIGGVINQQLLQEDGLPRSINILELNQLLQTTLDAQEQLEFFHQAMIQQLGIAGTYYRNDPLRIQHLLGKRALHQANYRLNIQNEPLGEITLTRRKRFSQSDLQHIENALVQLVYPLRNAIRYHKAMQSAFTDPLTGAENRAAFESSLKREIELSQRQHTPLSMIVLDIDHFKRVNDRYGHQAGDAVLKAVTQRVQHKIRNCDFLFRYGGEEFVILLSQTDLEEARTIGERVRAGIAKLQIDLDENGILAVTASFGATEFRYGEGARKFFDRADQAMYQAKSNGRNRIESA